MWPLKLWPLKLRRFHTDRITRKSVLEHALRAPRQEEIYDKARLQNPTLPATLETFVNESLDGERGTNIVVNGHAKSHKALMQGLQEARAKGMATRSAETRHGSRQGDGW